MNEGDKEMPMGDARDMRDRHGRVLEIRVPFCAHASEDGFAGRRFCRPDVKRAYMGALAAELEDVLVGLVGDGGDASMPASAVSAVSLFEAVAVTGHGATFAVSSQIADVIAVVRKSGLVAPGAEVSVEMAPGCVTGASYADLAGVGVNAYYIYLGSVGENECTQLRIEPSRTMFEQTVFFLNTVRADDFRVVLTVGIPGQTARSFGETLEFVRSFRPKGILLQDFAARPGDESRRKPDESWFDTAFEYLGDVYHRSGAMTMGLAGHADRAHDLLAAGAERVCVGIDACSSYDDIRYRNTSDLPLYIAASPDPERICVEVAKAENVPDGAAAPGPSSW